MILNRRICHPIARKIGDAMGTPVAREPQSLILAMERWSDLPFGHAQGSSNSATGDQKENY